MRVLRLIAFACALASTVTAARAQVLAMGTSPQGTWTYSAGATVAKVAGDEGLQMRVQPYGGTTTYVPLVNAGEIEFGLSGHLEVIYAVRGIEDFEGRKHGDIRVVAVLTPIQVALFVRADSGIRAVRDLKGKRVPSDYGSQRIIQTLINGELANGGLEPGDVVGVPVPNVNRGADDFAAGRADAFYFALGSAKVAETNAKVAIRALPLDTAPAAVAAMQARVPVAYTMRVDPAPARAGVLEPIDILAYDYLVIAHAGAPDAAVERLARALYGNRDALRAGFPPLAGFSPQRMARDLGELAYHPGALKFYAEAGLRPRP